MGSVGLELELEGIGSVEVAMVRFELEGSGSMELTCEELSSVGLEVKRFVSIGLGNNDGLGSVGLELDGPGLEIDGLCSFGLD